METQEIVNLLNGSNNESSEFATKKWYVIHNSNGNMKQAILMVQPLNFRQKVSNQIFVIIQVHVFS